MKRCSGFITAIILALSISSVSFALEQVPVPVPVKRERGHKTAAIIWGERFGKPLASIIEVFAMGNELHYRVFRVAGNGARLDQIAKGVLARDVHPEHDEPIRLQTSGDRAWILYYTTGNSLRITRMSASGKEVNSSFFSLNGTPINIGVPSASVAYKYPYFSFVYDKSTNKLRLLTSYYSGGGPVIGRPGPIPESNNNEIFGILYSEFAIVRNGEPEQQGLVDIFNTHDKNKMLWIPKLSLVKDRDIYITVVAGPNNGLYELWAGRYDLGKKRFSIAKRISTALKTKSGTFESMEDRSTFTPFTEKGGALVTTFCEWSASDGYKLRLAEVDMAIGDVSSFVDIDGSDSYIPHTAIYNPAEDSLITSYVVRSSQVGMMRMQVVGGLNSGQPSLLLSTPKDIAEEGQSVGGVAFYGMKSKWDTLFGCTVREGDQVEEEETLKFVRVLDLDRKNKSLTTRVLSSVVSIVDSIDNISIVPHDYGFAWFDTQIAGKTKTVSRDSGSDTLSPSNAPQVPRGLSVSSNKTNGTETYRWSDSGADGYMLLEQGVTKSSWTLLADVGKAFSYTTRSSFGSRKVSLVAYNKSRFQEGAFVFSNASDPVSSAPRVLEMPGISVKKVDFIDEYQLVIETKDPSATGNILYMGRGSPDNLKRIAIVKINRDHYFIGSLEKGYVYYFGARSTDGKNFSDISITSLALPLPKGNKAGSPVEMVSEIGGSGSGFRSYCFVATASSKGKDNEYVRTLTGLRDHALVKCAGGLNAILMYNNAAPEAAAGMIMRPVMKTLIMVLGQLPAINIPSLFALATLLVIIVKRSAKS